MSAAMTNIWRLGVPLLLMVVLTTGCTPHQPPKMVTVENRDVTHAVTYDNGHTMLSAEELYALDKFLEPISPLAVDSVVIERGDDAKTTLQRVQKLDRLLAARGFARSFIAYATANGGVSSMVTLRVRYNIANGPKNCPDWSDSAIANHNNKKFSNMGCATLANMAKHVANPGDLIKGKGDTTPDPDRNLRATTRYHMGNQTAASAPATTTSGSGSATTAASSQ